MSQNDLLPTIPPMPKIELPPEKVLAPFSTWKDKLNKPTATIPWVVESMLVSGTSTLLVGEGGLGKSWFAAHAALCVVQGLKVHGEFNVQRCGNVLWYDNENGADENDRRTQLLAGNAYKQSPYDVYMREVPDFYFQATEKGLAQMRADIIELRPALVIVDSMISTFYDDMSDNDAKDVRRIMDGITSTMQGLSNPPAFLLLHHTKKNDDDSEWPEFRGSSDFQNAVSFLITMRKHEKSVQFRFDKSRRGKRPDGIFEYELVDSVRNEGQPRQIVEYVPQARPVSFYEEIHKITEEIIRDGENDEAEIIEAIQERFSSPPSKPTLKNMFYKLTSAEESLIVRTKVPEGKKMVWHYQIKPKPQHH